MALLLNYHSGSADSSGLPPDAISIEINRTLAERRGTKKEDVTVFVVDTGFWKADGHGSIVTDILKKYFDGKIKNLDVEVGTTVKAESTITSKQIVDALQYVLKYAAAHPKTFIVVNMSWGIDFNPALEAFFAALSDHDIISVAAVGNDNRPACAFPAAYDGVIGVASVVQKNGKYVRSSYSNYGPGVDVAVLDHPYTILEVYTKAIPFYNRLSPSERQKKVKEMLRRRGTSFATPHVSGTIAQMLADDPQLSARGAFMKLQLSADWAEEGFDAFVPVLRTDPPDR